MEWGPISVLLAILAIICFLMVARHALNYSQIVLNATLLEINVKPAIKTIFLIQAYSVLLVI